VVVWGLSLSSAELTIADVGFVMLVEVEEVRGDAQNVAARSGGLIDGGLDRRGEFGMTLSFNNIGRDQGELKLRCRLDDSSAVKALGSRSSEAPLTLIKIRFFNSSGVGRACDSKSSGCSTSLSLNSPIMMRAMAACCIDEQCTSRERMSGYGDSAKANLSITLMVS
jgi:hypothetical protein